MLVVKRPDAISLILHNSASVWVTGVRMGLLPLLFRELHGFERQRTGSFRKWLRTIVDNRVKGHRRKRQHRPLALGMEPA
jgi:hypothetical protein